MAGRRNTKSIAPSMLDQIIPPCVEGREARSSFIRFRLDTPRPFDPGSLLTPPAQSPGRIAQQLRRRTHLK
jgi:hypothetical protein